VTFKSTAFFSSCDDSMLFMSSACKSYPRMSTGSGGG
jgi:hypothetical protein